LLVLQLLLQGLGVEDINVILHTLNFMPLPVAG